MADYASKLADSTSDKPKASVDVVQTPRPRKVEDVRPVTSRIVDGFKALFARVIDGKPDEKTLKAEVELKNEAEVPAVAEVSEAEKTEEPKVATETEEGEEHETEPVYTNVKVVGGCKEGEMGLPKALQMQLGVRAGGKINVQVGGMRDKQFTVCDIDPKIAKKNKDKDGLFVTMHHNKDKLTDMYVDIRKPTDSEKDEPKEEELTSDSMAVNQD